MTPSSRSLATTAPGPRLRAASAALLLVAGACAPRQPARVAPATLRECTLPGVAGPAHCGVHRVWENRASRAGRRLDLRVVVLPALDARPAADPLVLLAGGPGQAASELAALVARELEPVRRHRAIVLVDQRGTGASNALTCAGGMAMLIANDARAVRQCAGELAGRADVRQYTTAVAVEDLEEVRAALGYHRLNLVGVSYGTRVAQAYARRHPDRVRTITLRAVAPMGFNILLNGSLTAHSALLRVRDDCLRDTACGAAYPALAGELDSVLARAGRAPAHAKVALPGRTDSADVRIDRALVGQTLYALQLATPSRQQIPMLIHGAATSGLAALAPIAAQVNAALYGPLPVGQYLTVTCAEDAAVLGEADRGAMARAGFLAGIAGMVELCREWPRATVPPDFHDPVAWAGPALLVSGEVDPATDASQGAALAARWPAARHVVLPATAHGPMFPGCMRERVAEFIERASATGLDTGCLAALAFPPFAVSRRP